MSWLLDLITTILLYLKWPIESLYYYYNLTLIVFRLGSTYTDKHYTIVYNIHIN